MAENYDVVLEQLRAHGLVVESLEVSGRIVRVDCEDRPGKKHGWYIAHEFRTDDGRTFIVGSYGDWRQDERGQKISAGITGLSDAERARLKQQREDQRRAAETARRKLADQAAQRALSIWEKLPDTGSSPYLTRKQVRAWGLRFSRGSVVVPLRNDHEQLVGLQFIDPSGAKKFLTGTAKRGAWHWVGGEPTESGPIAIAEGYATAATVHQATGWPVAVAFDAGNLQPVLEAVRRLHPNRRIVVCGDDDHETDGNPGRAKVEALVERFGVVPALPEFEDPDGQTDWNDLHVSQGLDAVREQLKARMADAPARPPAAQAIEFSMQVLLEHFTMIHGTSLVYDGRRGRLMPISALNLSAGHGLVRHWLQDADRKMVNEEDVVFNPDMTPSARPQVNLFTGMRCKPNPNKACDLLIAHLYLLCGERDRLFDWVLKWLAYPLQHPGTKMATALVVYGSEGTGKNIFFDTVLDIYEPWGVAIGQEEIESAFNGWLSAKLFAVADEVVSRAELRHLKGRLKKLVTGQRVMINEKNQPVREERNCMNMVFLSNEDEPLRIDPGDRRYCAIRCDQVQESAYFERLGAQKAAGGAEALYHYLLTYDLDDFTPWTRPYETDEREGLMETAASPAVRFWNDWRAGDLPLPYVACRCQDLYQAFRAWCSIAGERFIPNDTQFGTSLRPYEGLWFRKDRPRIVDSGGNQKRPKCYVLLDESVSVETDDAAALKESTSKQVEAFEEAASQYLGQARKVRL